MKKDSAIFESVNNEKWRHSLKKSKIVSSSLKDGLFVHATADIIVFNTIFFTTKNTVPLSLEPWMFWTSDSHQQPSYWIYMYEKRHFFFKNAKN